jgi:hypothetical protein
MECTSKRRFLKSRTDQMTSPPDEVASVIRNEVVERQIEEQRQKREPRTGEHYPAGRDVDDGAPLRARLAVEEQQRAASKLGSTEKSPIAAVLDDHSLA